MKRNLWNLLQAAAVCVAMVVALPSCDDEDEINKNDDDDNTEVVDPDGTGTDTGTTTTENVFVTTDYITPIRYAEGNYYSEGAEDVTVNVTNVTTDNIVFTVTPSEEVKSYLVQVYPLATVYNTLLNQMNSAGASSLSLDESMDYVSQIVCLVESEYTGGKLMNEETLGSDYASYEFDWGNTGYLYFTIQQESEYLIVVQACFDEAGETLADLCLVHVTTPTVALQGSPEVSVNIEVGYSSYICNFVPNDDCYYVYYLVGDYDEIYQFVDAYGESLYRDFIRHYGSRASADSSDDLESYATNLSESAHMVATAIPLDFNGTPAANVFFEEFSLNTRPEGRVDATATMSLVRNSAHVAHFKAEMDMYTYCIYYNVLTRSEGEGYQSADEETRASYAEQLGLYGYGIANPNYGYDRTNDEYTGTSGTEERYWTLSPGVEYMFVWVARNAYGDLTDLCFSDPFAMKQLVTDAPETSKEDVVFTIPETSRTSVTLDFTYNPENTAIYFFQYYYPVVDNGDPEDEDYEPVVFPDIQDGSDEARYAERGWLYWFFERGWANAWTTEDSTHADWTDFGYEPASHFEYAYIGEDWDGVVGYVKFVSCDTKGNEGGPDPQITNVSWDSSTGYVTFETNDDSKMLYYSVVDYTGGHSAAVGLSELLKRGSGGYYKSEYLPMWEEWLISGDNGSPCGLTTTENSGRVPIALDSKISIALGMAEGTAEDGSSVYSDLYAYVYTPDVGLQTFEDYWNETGVVVTPSN